MTSPAPGLATIREDSDGDGSEDVALSEALRVQPAKGPLDSLDTEMFRRSAGASVKQMRVPKLKRGASAQSRLRATMDSADPLQNLEESQSFGKKASFLDIIGQSLADG